MSRKGCRRVLWAAAVMAAPVPFFLVETGLVPPARILLLGAASLALMVTEGSAGAVAIAAALLLGQAIFYLGATWLAADLSSRWIFRAAPRQAGLCTLAVVVAGLIAVSSFEVYRTPFRTDSLRATWLRVYE